MPSMNAVPPRVVTERIRPSIPLERILSRVFEKNGRVYWRNGKRKGFEVCPNSVDRKGYRRFKIEKKSFFVHSVVFALHHGRWPVAVDHISGDISDNRIENLREATPLDNSRNKAFRPRGDKPYIGVRRDDIRGGPNPWRATIGVNGRPVHLGYFPTAEEAISARKAAERKHGYHPNHGRASSDLPPNAESSAAGGVF